MNAVISVDLAMSVCPYARCDLGNYNLIDVMSETINVRLGNYKSYILMNAEISKTAAILGRNEN